jgi:NADPH:quinone reductase-like Zn-dependent oxidoreductase
MRAALIRKYGGDNVVELGDWPDPVPGLGDLLVRVDAASINPVDAKIYHGKVKVLVPYKPPFVLGNDLCGEVVATGPGVSRYRVGDAIYARLDKDRIGAFAQLALVRESAAALKPKNLSVEQAASIPLVGLTAFQVLVETGQLKRGQKVLIHAGSGGLGTFAIQFAKHLGATVVTTASERNHALVRSLGADQVIDYRKARFEEIVTDCDLALDTQGGETLERSFLAVKPGGLVVSVGGYPDAKFGRAYGLNAIQNLALSFLSRGATRAARRRGARFEFVFMRADGAQLAQLTTLLEQGTVKPVIDRTYPLAQIKEALAYSQTGRAVGKIVLTMR